MEFFFFFDPILIQGTNFLISFHHHQGFFPHCSNMIVYEEDDNNAMFDPKHTSLLYESNTFEI